MIGWFKSKFGKKEEEKGVRIALLEEKSRKEEEDDDEREGDEMQGAKKDTACLYVREDILAYKVVFVLENGEFVNDSTVAKTKALLTLQVTGNIYESVRGAPLMRPGRDTLKSDTKYCTNRLTVIGAQFIGPTALVYRAIQRYQQGRNRLASGYSHGNQFSYELECVHVEPRAGKPGCGCLHGLHFFTSPTSAIRHYGCLEDYNKTNSEDGQIIITKRLRGGRGLMIHTKNTQKEMKRKFDNIEYLADPYYPNIEPIDLRPHHASAKALGEQMQLVSFVENLLEKQKAATNSGKVKKKQNDDDDNDDNDSDFQDAVDEDSRNERKTTQIIEKKDSQSVIHPSASGLRRVKAKATECLICFDRASEKRPLTSVCAENSHLFHADCLAPYSSSSSSTSASSPCPKCKEKVFLKNKKSE